MSSKLQEMEAQVVLGQVQMNCELFEAESAAPIQLAYLQTRVATLETRLQQSIANTIKKEDYVNKLALDLEHIILQLQRLEVVKAGRGN
jgi:hypothetical protein